jgi:hypothetical protein
MFKILLLLFTGPVFAQTPPAPAPTEPTASYEPKNEGVDATPRKSFFDGRFGLVLGYTLNNNIQFREGELRSATGTTDYDQTIKTQSAPSIGIMYTRMHPNAWGFSGSFIYEFPRELKSYSGNPKLTVFLLEMNMLYRWDRFYIPFGINISAPYVKGGQLAHDVYQPMVGIYGAVGYLVTENAGMELFVRTVGVAGKKQNSGSTEDRPGNGYMSGIGVNLKYWF